MRIPAIIISVFLILNTLSYAQKVDQVSVGASYSNQAFYKISTGEVEVVANNAWDIAFSNQGIQDAGIFINESSPYGESPLRLFLASSSDWNEPITSTVEFTDDAVLYNPEENWIEGAFNSIKDPNSVFDYGWGAYDPMTNTVQGSKIFVIQKRNGSFMKLQIQQLSRDEYSFRYSALDGSNERSASVFKNDSENEPLIYFSFETDQEVDMPKDYDLVFQRYYTVLDNDGTPVDYQVTGVLLAPGLEAAVADGVDTETVRESDYADQYASLPTTIGHDWKFFDFSSGWLIDDDRAYFIKASDGKIYKIVFFDFEGASTGITTLEKTEVGIVNTQDNLVEPISWTIFPNPTSDYLQIKDIFHPVQLSIYNSLGVLVASKSFVSEQNIMDLENIESGSYFLTLSQEHKIIHSEVLVIRN